MRFTQNSNSPSVSVGAYSTDNATLKKTFRSLISLNIHLSVKEENEFLRRDAGGISKSPEDSVTTLQPEATQAPSNDFVRRERYLVLSVSEERLGQSLFIEICSSAQATGRLPFIRECVKVQSTCNWSHNVREIHDAGSLGTGRSLMSGPSGKPVIPISIGAGTVIQLLAGVACFLAAFALPVQIPEVAGLGQNILMGLGGFCFFVAFISIVFRRFFAKLCRRSG